MSTTSDYTFDFSAIGMGDLARVGGKDASLGQLFSTAIRIAQTEAARKAHSAARLQTGRQS